MSQRASAHGITVRGDSPQMKLRFFLGLGLPIIAAFISGCLSKPTLGPQSPRAMSVGASQMEKVHLVSLSVVSPQIGKRPEEFPEFEVSITNRGTQPLAISTANLSAFADSAPLTVYGPVEYIAKVQHALRVDAISVQARAQAAAIRSAWSTRPNAGQAPGIIGQATAVTDHANLRHKERRLLAAAGEMLWPSQVAAGQIVRGKFRLDGERLLAAEHVRIRVTLGTETHEFLFTVKH